MQLLQSMLFFYRMLIVKLVLLQLYRVDYIYIHFVENCNKKMA